MIKMLKGRKFRFLEKSNDGKVFVYRLAETSWADIEAYLNKSHVQK